MKRLVGLMLIVLALFSAGLAIAGGETGNVKHTAGAPP